MSYSAKVAKIMAEMEAERARAQAQLPAQIERSRKSIAACFEHDDYAAIECGVCGEFTPLTVAIIPNEKDAYRCRRCGKAVQIVTRGKYEFENGKLVASPIKYVQGLLC